MIAISFTLGLSQRPAATEGLAFTDGHHPETHNYRPACTRTGLAAPRRPSLDVQKIHLEASRTRSSTPTNIKRVAAWHPARCLCPRTGMERRTKSCSDNSSIMRTGEGLLTTAVKRFVGRI